MAATAITITKATQNGAVEMPATAALDATDGALISYNGMDAKTLIIIENTAASAGTATVKNGDSIQGVADLVVTVPASSSVAVTLESGAFKNVSGTNKGKVHITGAATIKVACIELP